MLMQIWQDAINYTAMPISVLTSYLNCADLSCNVTPIHCSNTPQKRFISSVGPWRSVQLLASTQSRDIDQKLLTNERTNERTLKGGIKLCLRHLSPQTLSFFAPSSSSSPEMRVEK